MLESKQCPLFETVKLIGDKWSLLIIRDIMFHDKRHFSEFIQSNEGIAKNILSVRLKKLVNNGFIVKAPDNTHKQKNKYTLNFYGIDLIPLMIEFFKFNCSASNLSEKDLELYIKIQEDRTGFEENLKNKLIGEIEFVFENNPDLRKETLSRMAPEVTFY